MPIVTGIDCTRSLAMMPPWTAPRKAHAAVAASTPSRPLSAPALTASTPPSACMPSTETSNSPARIVSPSASATSPSEAKPCRVLKTSKSLSSWPL